MSKTQTERTRAFVAEWLAGVPIIAAPVSEFVELTRTKPMRFERLLPAEQMHERAQFESRLRSGSLRAIPTCFGDIA